MELYRTVRHFERNQKNGTRRKSTGTEKTVFDDWSGFLCEGKYFHAKILEYTGAEYGGYYKLTHEWYYEYENGNYHRIGEKGFEDEKL